MFLHLVLSAALTWLGVTASNINTQLSRSYASSQSPGHLTYEDQMGLLVLPIFALIVAFIVINIITAIILRKLHNKGIFNNKNFTLLGRIVLC